MVSNADASVATRLSHDLTILAGYRRAVAACGERERVLLAWLGVDDCRVGVRAMLDGPDPPRGFVLAGSLIVFEALGALIQAGRTGRVGRRRGGHRRRGATVDRALLASSLQIAAATTRSGAAPASCCCAGWGARYRPRPGRSPCRWSSSTSSSRRGNYSPTRDGRDAPLEGSVR